MQTRIVGADGQKYSVEVSNGIATISTVIVEHHDYWGATERRTVVLEAPANKLIVALGGRVDG